MTKQLLNAVKPTNSLKKIQVKYEKALPTLAKLFINFQVGNGADALKEAAEFFNIFEYKDSKEEVLFSFVTRSFLRASLELLSNSNLSEILEGKIVVKELQSNLESFEMQIDLADLFSGSSSLSGLLEKMLCEFLEAQGVDSGNSITISQRLKSYLPLAMHIEWIIDKEKYSELQSLLDSPFMSKVSKLPS